MAINHLLSSMTVKEIVYKYFTTNHSKSKYGKRSFRVFAKASLVLALHALSFYRIKSVIYGFEFGKKIGERFILEFYRHAPIRFCN